MASTAAAGKSSEMPWTRLDDGFHHHPKILALTDSAHRLFVDTLNWSVANLTDGHVPLHVPNICLPHGTDRTRKSAIAELVGSGLWMLNGAGWVIHDFDDYQETKEEVRARREKWANRKRSTRDSTVETMQEPPRSAPVVSTPDPVRTRVPSPNPSPKTEAKASIDDEHQINRDGIWTALEDLFGKAATKTERSLRGKVVNSLVGAGATYTSIKERAPMWPKLFPGRNGQPPPTFTHTSLEKWWGALGLILETKELKAAPCQVCDSRRIVGISVDGEVVKVDDPRAVANDRCVCVS